MKVRWVKKAALLYRDEEQYAKELQHTIYWIETGSQKLLEAIRQTQQALTGDGHSNRQLSIQIWARKIQDVATSMQRETGNAVKAAQALVQIVGGFEYKVDRSVYTICQQIFGEKWSPEWELVDDGILLTEESMQKVMDAVREHNAQQTDRWRRIYPKVEPVHFNPTKKQTPAAAPAATPPEQTPTAPAQPPTTSTQ